jgi:uncharacterized protein (TIGR00255 family)
MIRSMTGYGAAEQADDLVRVAAEIRTLNNRFLKVNQHLPEGLGAAEVAIEKIIREGISRGTVNLNLAVEPRGAAVRAPINTDILAAYGKDLAAAAKKIGAAVSLEALLALPGVVGSEQVLLTGIADLPARVEAVVAEAVRRLNLMRDAEGQATAEDMRSALDEMERRIADIHRRVPAVVKEYRERLRARVAELLEGLEVAADDQALAREVAFAAERSDIAEELSRLASHICQFRELLDDSGPGGRAAASPPGAGRKLEFLTQEMYREANTIGSKASDAQVSRLVVDIKVGVDRLREQSQNVE